MLPRPRCAAGPAPHSTPAHPPLLTPLLFFRCRSNKDLSRGAPGDGRQHRHHQRGGQRLGKRDRASLSEHGGRSASQEEQEAAAEAYEQLLHLQMQQHMQQQGDPQQEQQPEQQEPQQEQQQQQREGGGMGGGGEAPHVPASPASPGSAEKRAAASSLFEGLCTSDSDDDSDEDWRADLEREAKLQVGGWKGWVEGGGKDGMLEGGAAIAVQAAGLTWSCNCSDFFPA